MSEELSRIGAAVQHVLVTILHDITGTILDPFGEFTRPGQPTVVFFGVNAMGQVTGQITGLPKLRPDATYEWTISGPTGESQIVTSAESTAQVVITAEDSGEGTIVERQLKPNGQKSKPTAPATFDIPDPFTFDMPVGDGPTVTFPDPETPTEPPVFG